jgi:hypothetical protein
MMPGRAVAAKQMQSSSRNLDWKASACFIIALQGYIALEYSPQELALLFCSATESIFAN